MADYPIAYQDEYVVGSSNIQALDVLSNDVGTGLTVVDFNRWSVNGVRVTRDSSDRGKKRNLIYNALSSNFVGEDEFWYVLEDAQGRRNAAKVKVTISSQTLNPRNDQVSVNKNTSIRIDALGNDSVVTQGPRTIVKIAEFNEWSKKGGRIKLESVESGTPLQFLYTPKSDFIGEDEFWYVIDRVNASPEAAKVVINVTDGQSSSPYPVGKQDDLTVIYGGRGSDIAYFPLDNDIGDNLRLESRSGYSLKGGSYKVTGKGTLKYRAPSSLLNEDGGTDKIWYVIEDALGRKQWSVINFTLPPFRSNVIGRRG
ncbi:MAG: Ig-like domain-containing protein [Leucothrix sp.]